MGQDFDLVAAHVCACMALKRRTGGQADGRLSSGDSATVGNTIGPLVNNPSAVDDGQPLSSSKF